VNFKQSKGNYFVDIDGNTILDMNASASGQILGYNHDDLIHARDSELYDRFVTHKVDANTLPPHDFADIIREQVMPSAPKGMQQVHVGGGNTADEANELAMAVAMEQYSKSHNVEMNKLCVVGFNNSHHGNSTATLSVSSTNANSNNLPAFPWPKAEFPQLKYPLSAFEHENKAEEDRCLAGFREIINAQRASGNHVAAVIVEPISSLGNQIATPYFFKQLRRMTADEGISMIVDETKTGMGQSGKNWAHDYWYLSADNTPDFMTFGGKSGLSGFYSTLSHRLNDEAASFSQNVDMVKLLTYGQTWKIIENSSLLDLNKDASSFLKIELNRVAE